MTTKIYPFETGISILNTNYQMYLRLKFLIENEALNRILAKVQLYIFLCRYRKKSCIIIVI